MSRKVIRGYWDCSSCGTKGIDGLVDKCPNCGAGKPKETKYYMKDLNRVSDEDLAKAGIGKDENDGKHKEWVCPYCGQLNNYSSTSCVNCGAPKDSKELEYGDYAKKKAQEETESSQPVSVNKGQRGRTILAVILLIAAVLFFPLSKKSEVTDRYWQSYIYVEEEQIVEESDWTLPDGAELIETRQEIQRYERVIDHYETVEVTRSREVPDGEEEVCSYEDNGNGTFTEDCTTYTTYRTEYYTDYEQEAVYRDEPVYATKYYYEILKWVTVDTYTMSGSTDTVEYSDSYTLQDGQRDTSREAFYYIGMDGEEAQETDYEEYSSCSIGSVYVIRHNLLGMEYSRKMKK